MTSPESLYEYMHSDDSDVPKDARDETDENGRVFAASNNADPQPTHSNFDLMDDKKESLGAKGAFPEDDQSAYSDGNIDMEELGENVAWSMLSDLFFLGGSLGYLFLAIWDAISPPAFAFSEIIYHIVEATGPVVYMLNSAIDVYWANLVRTKDKMKRQLSNRQLVSPFTEENSKPKRKKSKLLKIRKHAAHRRGLLAALSFGGAAFFAMVDLLIWYFGDYEKTMIAGSDRAIIDALSVHLYLLSAIFAVTGKRTRPRTFAFSLMDPDNLEDLGDFFFLVGSLVDVTLCDFHFDDNIPFWSIFSCVLWFLDACFYLRSDFVTKAVYDEVTLLHVSGYLGSSSVGSTRSVILMNRLAKASGDKKADERLATFISQDNGTLV